MSSDVAIRVSNLSKCYQIYDKPRDRLLQGLFRGRKRFFREFWALRDISFEVRKGETVGIIGRNGAGKSTLLQIVSGTVVPTSGEVSRSGRVSALLELGSGFNPEFTGRENVYLSAMVSGLSKEQINERFSEIEAFAEIGDFINSPVKHYSSGMFARLAFSVAIHVDPEILIVDEILAVGDAAFQRRCVEKFYQIRESGCTILFVSHDPYQVKSICQRALYLEYGQQAMFDHAGRVIDQYMIDMEGAVAHSKASRTLTRKASRSGSRDHEDADAAIGRKVSREDDALLVQSSAVSVQKAAASRESGSELFRITKVELQSDLGELLEEVRCGQNIRLRMHFKAVSSDLPDLISFVFNLYRHDDLYICGTTTLMDGFKPHKSGQSGIVTVNFDGFPLLSGRYKWRVAINDHGGFLVLAEAKEVCPFKVTDDFNAIGLVNVGRNWQIEIE